jgi:hypothetical protein
MSDSRRTYRAIKGAIKQLCPVEPQGNQARHLNTLVGLITGIVLSKSCQLPKVAAKVPEAAKPESRTKRFSRWVQGEAITTELYFLPFVATLLTVLAASQPQLVLMMDGSEVGRGCLALVVSVLYAHRALPVAWLVVKGKKGHFPTEVHVQLLQQVIALVPAGTAAVFLGDGEFDSPELQAAVDSHGWQYACRTAKNIQIWYDGAWQALETIGVCRGRKKMWRHVGFTKTGYGPVQVIGWWSSDCDEPVYLVTNFLERDEACQWYQKRTHIETLFSDQKSRGFHLNLSHLADPARLNRLLIATCLAYLWIVYLGAEAIRTKWQGIIHRAKRCDLSLFQLGLRLLDHLLAEDAPLPIAFLPDPTGKQIFVYKSVR